MCSVSDVRETISTSEPSYGPGSLVIMASSIRNASNSVCSIAVGPTSPSMTVTSSHGAQVWNGCYVNGHPGACALYLVVQSLEPGAAYTKTVSWDQRSGAAAARVPVGVYELSAQFSGIALRRTTRFDIAAKAPSGVVTVTQAESGRSYTLRHGEHLYVQLSGPSNYTWSAPVSSRQVVLARTQGTPGAIATATFVARSVGRVQVTAVDNPNCYPQCLAPSRPFVVKVSVIG